MSYSNHIKTSFMELAEQPETEKKYNYIYQWKKMQKQLRSNREESHIT